MMPGVQFAFELDHNSKANSISHRSPVAMTECKNWVHCMATIKGARTVALAAAIAGGACSAKREFANLRMRPQASWRLNIRGGSSTTAFFASPELFNGSSLVDTLTTQGFQGWVSNVTTVLPSVAVQC